MNASRLRVWVLLLAVCLLLAIACAPAWCIVLQPGWPQTTEYGVTSSPALGDLDGDGKLEIVVGSDHAVGSESGPVYAWDDDGTALPGWPQRVVGEVRSGPGLCDLDQDGKLEVVAAATGHPAESAVYAWRADGTPLAGWPQSAPGVSSTYFGASPAFGDLDGDGDPEVLLQCANGVLAWHANGTPVAGWPPQGSPAGITTPALGDLDNDGDLEVVAGGWQHWVYAWHGDGTLVAGWPQYAPQEVNSSAALGDLDGDGDLEVVTGSRGGDVYAWHGDGQVVTGWPQYAGGPVWSSPALGDIDGDGSPEVVVGAKGVWAWHGDGSVAAGWPQVADSDVTSSPALADVDGDGGLDVVIGVWVLLEGWNGNGEVITGWPHWTDSAVWSSPAIADLDGDGDVEVVVGSYDKKVYVWTTDLPATDSVPWPMFRHDLHRTGVYGGPQEVPVTAGKIAGRVEVAGSATPIAGATVAAYLGIDLKGTATTGADGTYIMPGVPAGIYDVVAAKESYSPQTLTGIIVVAGETTEANFSLEPFCTIKGQVREVNTSTNIAGATVTASLDGQPPIIATTDGLGMYVIETDVPSTEYAVSVAKAGYVPQTKRHISLSLGTITYVNFFRLERAVPLKGQVRNRYTGAPLPGARVDVHDSITHAFVISVTTDSPTGIYLFRRPGLYLPLAPGTYTLTASMAGYASQTKWNIVVTADGGTYCNFNLEPTTLLRGQIRDATAGVPLDGATVDVLKDGVVWRSGASEPPYGLYEIAMYAYQDLPTESSVVRASKPGYVRQYKSGISIAAGGTTYVNFALQRSGRLQGQVVDNDTGLPLIGAVVTASKGGIRWATGMTTLPWGIYEINSDLPEGTYDVTAVKPGYSAYGKADIGVTAGETTYVNFWLWPE